MGLKVRASDKMSRTKSPLGNIEDRLIRIPKELRDKTGFKTGTFLRLKNKEGKDIALQVTHAYKENAEVESRCAYVSEDIYKELDLKAIQILDPAADILIGCDPEFFLIDNQTNRTVSASYFFPHYGQVGSDMGLAELRPRPATDPRSLLNNISALLHRASEHLKERKSYRNRDVSMIAASSYQGASAGFHIHFGLPKVLLAHSDGAYNLRVKIVNVLDFYIGVPSMLPEGDDDCYRRSLYNNYGKPGDFRSESITLEYRVPGGHLLRHPLLTMGLLSISALVIKDILTRFKAQTNGYTDLEKLRKPSAVRKLYPNLPHPPDIYEIVTRKECGPAIKMCTEKILPDLTKMIGYKNNEKYVTQYFQYIVDCLGDKRKRYGSNIEQNWRRLFYNAG